MKKKVLALLAYSLAFTATFAQNDGYKYVVDLTKVNDDKLLVELTPPKIKEKQSIFYMPKIVPGTYKVADYGRFVTEFTALDKKGNTLEVSQLDENSWQINRADKLRKITYMVDDSYDADMGDTPIYPMAGTNIEDGQNFVINTSGFFGYFKDQKQKPYEINIVRPKSFYGSTGLIADNNQSLASNITLEGHTIETDSEIDRFSVSDYNLLIDSPLMYNEPDTTVINVGGTQVLISVYARQGMVTSEFVAETLEEILMAQMEFLGGKLPVEKYAFIFYTEDLAKIQPIQGALEHSYSSFYYLPEVDQQYLTETLRDVAAHEFFHIVTPLNIHSEEIHNFDFNDPQMSKHLWLYEGMTEYFANHMQVKYGIIDLETYLNKMRDKMITASLNYDDELSFTDLSEFTISKYPEQYGNVYAKGALIGMCLDIKLRDLSGGDFGTQDLLSELSKKYGKDQPFKDDELFRVIEELTYPEISEFIETYIVKGGILPYDEIFKTVGINYTAEKMQNNFTLGHFGLGYDEESQLLFVSNIDNVNEFGKAMKYQIGDKLTQFNGQKIPQAGIQQFFDKTIASMKEGETFKAIVLRKTEAGEEEEVELSSTIFKVGVSSRHELEIDESPSEQQLSNRNSWLTPKTN